MLLRPTASHVGPPPESLAPFRKRGLTFPLAPAPIRMLGRPKPCLDLGSQLISPFRCLSLSLFVCLSLPQLLLIFSLSQSLVRQLRDALLPFITLQLHLFLISFKGLLRFGWSLAVSKVGGVVGGGRPCMPPTGRFILHQGPFGRVGPPGWLDSLALRREQPWDSSGLPGRRGAFENKGAISQGGRWW